jgi:hypothetical protein
MWKASIDHFAYLKANKRFLLAKCHLNYILNDRTGKKSDLMRNAADRLNTCFFSQYRRMDGKICIFGGQLLYVLSM